MSSNSSNNNKKYDGDNRRSSNNQESRGRRPARESDSLLGNTRSSGGQQSTSYEATATAVSHHHHYLEDSQQLRARRRTASRSPPIGNLYSAAVQENNNNMNTESSSIDNHVDDARDESRTSAASTATEHDEITTLDTTNDDGDDDQSSSLLSAILAGQAPQAGAQTAQHNQGQNSEQNSISTSSIPALQQAGGGSIASSSYQNFASAGGAGGDATTICSADTRNTMDNSTIVSTQNTVGNNTTASTTAATTGPATTTTSTTMPPDLLSSQPLRRDDDDTTTSTSLNTASANSLLQQQQQQQQLPIQKHQRSRQKLQVAPGSPPTEGAGAQRPRQAGFHLPNKSHRIAEAQHSTPPSHRNDISNATKQQQQQPNVPYQHQQQQHHQHQPLHSQPQYTGGTFVPPPQQQQRGPDEDDRDHDDQPPLLEIPEEIYAVRKAALKVLKPLTKTWIVISVGFALTVLFGMARWTRLLPGIPFWFILLPSWSAHVGLLWLHVLSARALSSFIAEANESRQRPDSRDHLNRTEYLPLLQRSLKFGLKTGVLSFFVFIFEILIFIRLARNTISLNAAFIPLWFLICGGIIDGFICRTQHFLRVISWLLTFAAMVLLVLKVDYDLNAIRWRFVFSPVVAVLSIASGNLIYIVYGHQIGYYRLTEAQLTAGNLYSLAALICIILVVMIGEVIPLSRPVEVETRLFVVILAPLVVCLVGMGAWVVSRDEFGRLLLYGGQAAVHPMKLRWESKGWTAVQGKGVTVIPMFGEVSFRPLERRPRHHHGHRGDDSVSSHNSKTRNSRSSASTDRFLELCVCCTGGHCYPYEEDEEEETTASTAAGDGGDGADQGGRYHPYLDASSKSTSKHAYNMLRGL